MLSIPYALDALNFLSADVRNLFGPFINLFLVTSQHWTQTDVGLISTGSGVFVLFMPETRDEDATLRAGGVLERASAQ